MLRSFNRPIYMHGGDRPDHYRGANLLGKAAAENEISVEDACAEVSYWTIPDGLDPCGYRMRMAWAVRDAASEWERELRVQARSAAKVVGPALSRGACKADVAALARASAPNLPSVQFDEVLDQEAAWWMRWRHERDLVDNREMEDVDAG